MRPRLGFTLIELMIVILIIGVLLALIAPAVQSSREAARRLQCQNNLKQLALAAANYQANLSVYPFGVGGGGPPGPGRVPRWSAHSQLLIWLELTHVYNSLNFSGVAWMADPVYGPPNQTGLATKIAVFLCPSDSDWSSDPYDLGHTNYRGNAGTLPYNLAADSADGTGRNDGVFWYQSAVGPAAIQDGGCFTALFSERCLGTAPWPDLKGDYYMNGPAESTCLTVTPGVSARYGVPHERSGQRWGDGGLFYTRYNHVFPPNKPSCLLGGTTDYDSQVIVTATSRHPGGVNLATVDGAVRFVKDQVDPAFWRAQGTIAGGDMVGDCGY
jgi:prepilin-type N-terminal cleavage/methylation domain-containing protein/prepilin-type processing-associated H-X9-DG protein